MKKIIKTGVVLVCAAFVLFLLLPFLLPAGTGARPAGDGKAQPQIFTSNPLTKLVNRLARIFQSKNAPGPQAGQLLTQAQADARFGIPVASQQPGDQAPAQTETETTYLDDEGDWVLVRQVMPQSSANGMHEINVKENAYDRYEKQQRAARYTPAPAPRNQTKEPDSKLARLAAPVKQLFTGNSNSAQTSGEGKLIPPVSGRPADASASRPSRTSASGPNAPADFTQATPESGFKSFFSLLSPHSTLRDAAARVAGALYPDTSSRQQQAAQEQEKQAKEQQYLARLNQKLQQRLLSAAEGRAPQDQLLQTIACSAENPFTSLEGLCHGPDTEQVAALRAANQAKFFEKTNTQLPNTPLAVILSRAEPGAILPELQQNIQAYNPDPPAGLLFYEFMANQTDCSAGCYWVANDVPLAGTPRLHETIQAAGVTFRPDPMNRLPQLKEAFLQSQLAQLPPEATEEEKQQLQASAATANPAYLLYSAEDLRQLQARNTALLEANAPAQENGAVLYVSTAADAQAVAQDLNGDYRFVYGRHGEALNADYEQAPLQNRAEALVNDLADYVNAVAQITQEIKTEAVQQAVNAQLAPVMEQIRQELEKQHKEFDPAKNRPADGLL